jgi:hypothetical protein
MARVRGVVEQAIRGTVLSGTHLATPARGAPFSVARLDDRAMVLLLGQKEAWTPLAWECLEGIVPFLAGRGWVEIGTKYDTRADPATLDGYLKGYLKRATAGWVAAVLEHAGVVEVDRRPPAHVRLVDAVRGRSAE